MANVYYTSWSGVEAEFELGRLGSLPFKNKWFNANKVMPNGPGDVYLSTNGYNHRGGSFKKCTLIWESYTYLRDEYVRYDVPKWDHKFHFNNNYAFRNKSSLVGIGSWWRSELATYGEAKRSKSHKYNFGMVLSRKNRGSEVSDVGYYRSDLVSAAKGRSFRYYGCNWSKDDPNYGGEAYIAGSRSNPIKFNDACRLMFPCKFVFALENTYDKVYSVGYLTEKIFHGFLSRSVPIYFGCYNVEELLPNIYIDYRKFKNFKEVMDYCERMPDSEYNGYLDRIEEWLRSKGDCFTCESRFLDLDSKLFSLYGQK